MLPQQCPRPALPFLPGARLAACRQSALRGAGLWRVAQTASEESVLPARPGSRLEASPRCARRRPGMAKIAQAPLPAPTPPIPALSRLVACPRKELPWMRWQELAWAPPEAPASRPHQAAWTSAGPRLKMHRAWAPPELASRPHRAAWTYACPRLKMHRAWACQPMWTRFGRTATQPLCPARRPPDRAMERRGPPHVSALALVRRQLPAGHRLRCRWPLRVRSIAFSWRCRTRESVFPASEWVEGSHLGSSSSGSSVGSSSKARHDWSRSSVMPVPQIA